MRFPKNPIEGMKQPLVEGGHPFAEPHAREPATDNPFGTDAEETAPAEQIEYVATLEPRVGWIWGLALAGLICLPISLLGFVAMAQARYIGVLSLGLSVPALLLGWHELRAMKAGAMHRDRRAMVQIGTILAGCGVVLAILFTVLVIFITVVEQTNGRF